MSEIVPDGTNFVPHDIWWIYVADQSCGTIIFGNKSKKKFQLIVTLSMWNIQIKILKI